MSTNSSKDLKSASEVQGAEEPNTYSTAAMLGELLFTLMPFAVLFLIYLFQEKAAQAFVLAPEWAFASAILFGQTIVKFVQGVIESTKRYSVVPESVGLIVSGLIVLGLVPAMVILALILVTPAPPIWLGYVQVFLFLIAAVSFLFLGAIAHEHSVKARRTASGGKA